MSNYNLRLQNSNSKIDAINAQLQELIDKANSLPDAGSSEDLNAILTEQENLINTLKEKLEGKAAGHDSSILDALIDKSITEITIGAETIGNNAMYYCRSLELADLLKARTINQSAFYRCQSLVTVILRSDTVCTLANTSAFSYCYHFLGTQDNTYNPNGDMDGYFYVPKTLLASYQSATNWSTYSTQFRAIEDYPDICGGVS